MLPGCVQSLSSLSALSLDSLSPDDKSDDEDEEEDRYEFSNDGEFAYPDPVGVFFVGVFAFLERSAGLGFTLLFGDTRDGGALGGGVGGGGGGGAGPSTELGAGGRFDAADVGLTSLPESSESEDDDDESPLSELSSELELSLITRRGLDRF